MSKAVAFFAGMGAGYLGRKDKEQEQERQDARDKRDQELHDAKMGEITQAQRDRAQLRTAAAPVDVTPNSVKPETMDNRDVGQPGEAPLPQDGWRVGAKTFAERGLADAEAAAQNDPKAVRSRVMAALAGQGNVAAADQLRTSGIQADAAQITIDKARRDEANQLFDSGLREAIAKGPDALAQFMSDSHADGNAGATKFKAVPSADGKSFQIHRVSDDGALSPIGPRISNDEQGMATAGFMLSRAVPDKDKLAHLLAVKEAERKADHDKRQLDIAQQNADTTEQWRRDQAENMRRQRELQAEHDKLVAAGKRKPGDPIQVDLKDMRDFEGDLNGYIKDQFPVKDGATPEERAQINAQATSKKALGTALFRNNASVGIPLTAGTVLQAVELAGDRKNVRVVQVNGVPHEAVVVNGQPVITSGPLQRREQSPGSEPPRDEWIRNAPPGTARRPGPADAARAGVHVPPQGGNVATPSPQDRIAEIQQALATDDGIKNGGLGGMGGRAIQAGALPLGIGERRSLEQELARLQGGR